MASDDYERKRDFNRTPEPRGGAAVAGRPVFVVQLHHASRRHYDFRLQVGDTLRSWAVPKGPSYDPAVKRMAVEVEDHPLAYAGFEGRIPRGQYGGGHVALFDRGTWATSGDVEAQLAKGHLEFELFGDRLKGGWHLIRTSRPARQPQWLLVKAKDAWAGSLEADDLLAGVTPAPAADAARAGSGKPRKANQQRVEAPGRRSGTVGRALAREAAMLRGARKAALELAPVSPQLATLHESPPKGEGWIHEIKWDGYRLVAMKQGRDVRIWSRNGLPWQARVPELRDALLQLPANEVALDGELIAGRGTREDFNLLQRVLSGEAQAAIGYAAFDLLHLDGIDLRDCTLEDRKALLARLLAEPPSHVSLSTHVTGNGALAHEEAVAAGFEGIVSKQLGTPYAGGRSDRWRKTKAFASEEFAVVGYTPPKGSRRGIGALLLATPDGRRGWRYAGRVGSGIKDALLLEFGREFAGRGTEMPSVHVPDHDTDLRGAKWLPPERVVEVFVRGRGSSGLLRQASFKSLRPDKSPADLAGEMRMEVKRTQGAREGGDASSTPGSAAEGLPAISNGDKWLFPDDRISKQQLVDYCLSMADWLLPEISGRPLSIIRCPGGIDAPCFFQKHATPGMERVNPVPLEEESGSSDEYITVADLPGLVELVQFNAIEFHPWAARAESPDVADYLVFDLDPGEQVAWAEVIRAAREVRDLLSAAGLASFVRTSGGKGLHVVVPLSPSVPWSRAKPFARAFAESLAAHEPLRYVATASKKFRKGRIFVDWLRNGRGATSVASFSPRARPGAPVAMPLRWSELGRVPAGNAYDIASAPRRMRRMKGHPWGDFTAIRQGLPDIAE